MQWARRVCGNELDNRAFATAASDMLMKEVDHNSGGNNIRFGDSFTDDQFEGETYDYFLTNPPFGVDWKKQKYWLNMDQYKEYRRLRTIDFLWLLMSSFAAGLLLLAGIIWKNEWWGLFLKLIAYEIIRIGFAYFRNPTWWFMHPVWEISTALYVICGFFATIQLLLYTEPDPVFRSKTIYYSEPVPQPW